ncbi:glutamate racemase [Actinomycetospora sp. TBRC 11914]|nr:glutamate racemase [Actinomycetospora sp. TBRC 11914]
MLPTAGWLRYLRPDVHLDLFMDPAGMPWGARAGEWIVDRVLGAARLAIARGADAVVVPCNTASVTALVPLRAELEPDRPVVGTVPAVKPAASGGEPFGIWATERTSASAYQADLVALFATPGQATAVPCPGLADAVEAADAGAVAAAVGVGASRTPADARGIVLGCTHYPLVSDAIAAALPGVRLYDSSRAVAGQALRRLGLDPAPDADPAGLSVLLSGDEGDLPATARAYPVGAALATAGPVDVALLPPPVRDDALAEAGSSVPGL